MYRRLSTAVSVATVAVLGMGTLATSTLACAKGDARANTPAVKSDTATAGTVANAGTAAGDPSTREASTSSSRSAPATASATLTAADRARTPNEMGRIPVLEYHLIEEREWRWGRNYDRFRQDLETLYANGYRPVTMKQVLDRK